MDSYVIIVIPFDNQKKANQDADKIDKGKTSKTFTVGLSPTGQLPITHCWCCWWMSDRELTELQKDFDGTPDNDGHKNADRVFNLSKGWTPQTILDHMNLKTIKTDIAQLP